MRSLMMLLMVLSLGACTSPFTGPQEQPVPAGQVTPGQTWPGHDAPLKGRRQPVAELRDDLSHAYIADKEHFFAVYAQCGDGECAARLASTKDGGSTWAHYDLPMDRFKNKEPRIGELTFTLTVIGPQTLQFRQWDAKAKWVTVDGGATWRKAPPAAKPVQEVPNGWRVTDLALLSTGGKTYFYAGDPATGQIAPVVVPAGLTIRELPGQQAIWLKGSEFSGRIHVGVSNDLGKTWQESTLIPVEGVTHLSATADGATVYLTSSWFHNHGTTNPQSVIHRSIDGGKNWATVTPTGLPSSTRAESSMVLKDGTLVLLCGLNTKERTFHASRDGGKTFTPVVLTGYPENGSGLWGLPGGGYTATLPASEVRVKPPFYLSEDGLTWREITPPEAGN